MNPFFLFFKKFRKYSRNHVIKASILTIAVIVYSVFSEFFIEDSIVSSGIHSLFSSLWWTMQTITTVGYGDTPVYGLAGRANGMLIMVIGIGSLGYLMAGLTSMLIDIRLSSKLGERMAAEKKHIVLCNYNESTKKVLDKIKYDGIDIVILNENEVKGDNEYTYIKGSFLRENDLIRAGIKKASSVIIFSRSEDKEQMAMDAESILSAMIIRKLNPEIRIIGEILNPDSREHASSFMDDIIIKGDVSSMLIYSSIMIPGIPEFINDLLMSNSISEEDIDKKYASNTYREFISNMEKENRIVLAFRKQDKIYLRENSDKKIDVDSYIFIKN
ncbi:MULTISPECIES: potassium channel family protein [Ferroplasma]|uniref:potassium channel family protein n=1 Tax=Ferroplasma TaxID=74968 RepID=UPI000038E0DD|nr:MULTISPECIES: potassium channel family protein [Ferroplasma]WMT52778.1 MAG: potassium channel family protein [Ferroplasma acidiphilum]